jgi:hypothetical protein
MHLFLRAGFARSHGVRSRSVDSRDEFFDSAKPLGEIDTLAFRDHNYVYVTPTEVGQARRVKARQRVEAN